MVPRSRKYYEGATTSHWRIDDRLFFRFRRPRDPPVFCVRRGAPGGVGGPLPARAFGCRSPAVPTTSRGRQWDLSSIQVIHPVPLLRSWTPVEPMYPCLGGHTDAAPA
jgi:hypothetical protein